MLQSRQISHPAHPGLHSHVACSNNLFETRSGSSISPDSCGALWCAENGSHHAIRLFEFVRMPFGLQNTAQTFQCFMDQIARDQWRADDWAIRPPFRPSLAAHAANLLSVLEAVCVNKRVLTACLVGLCHVEDPATFELTWLVAPLWLSILEIAFLLSLLLRTAFSHGVGMTIR